MSSNFLEGRRAGDLAQLELVEQVPLHGELLGDRVALRPRLLMQPIVDVEGAEARPNERHLHRLPNEHFSIVAL